MNSRHAKGPFEVKLNPQPAYNTDPASLLGRMSLDKQFHGDLEATSKGEMLTAMSTLKGSGAYVDVERVTGTLDGKTGSFSLQHSGTMARGAQQLVITVVPDSGDGELQRLEGKMSIEIAAGKHSYVLEYSLPEIA
ncbi:MAG: DUF3224 domain-containing protein [Gemmatimonadaceae bacterium]